MLEDMLKDASTQWHGVEFKYRRTEIKRETQETKTRVMYGDDSNNDEGDNSIQIKQYPIIRKRDNEHMSMKR